MLIDNREAHDKKLLDAVGVLAGERFVKWHERRVQHSLHTLSVHALSDWLVEDVRYLQTEVVRPPYFEDNAVQEAVRWLHSTGYDRGQKILQAFAQSAYATAKMMGAIEE